MVSQLLYLLQTDDALSETGVFVINKKVVKLYQNVCYDLSIITCFIKSSQSL